MELEYYFDRTSELSFVYKVDKNKLVEAAIVFYSNVYDAAMSNNVKNIISGLIFDGFLNYKKDEGFVEFLKDECYELAQAKYYEILAQNRDPYEYRGVSRRDF